MLDKKTNKQVAGWLLSGCFLIFAMVVLGGITRLTGSGLSITEWNVIMGALPPLNEHQWQEAFAKYQQIPQFQKLNYDFTLQDFKGIFFWEYLHRLVGRLIGVVFLVPFLYFLIRRKIEADFSKPFIFFIIGFLQMLIVLKLFPLIINFSVLLFLISLILYVSYAFKSRILFHQLIFLFILGGLQGFLGWFMVKSGLTERTSVSQYRLAIHLITAFITFGFTWWFALQLLFEKKNEVSSISLASLLKYLFAFLMLQIIYGAFVSGLHAGKIANTFPTMDGEWIPAGINAMSPGYINLFENPLTVQFIHRCLAMVIVVMIFIAGIKLRNNNFSTQQRKAIMWCMLAVAVQFTLGLLTLLHRAPIALAAFHQIGGFFLFTSVLTALYFFQSRTSNPTAKIQ